MHFKIYFKRAYKADLCLVEKKLCIYFGQKICINYEVFKKINYGLSKLKISWKETANEKLQCMLK